MAHRKAAHMPGVRETGREVAADPRSPAPKWHKPITRHPSMTEAECLELIRVCRLLYPRFPDNLSVRRVRVGPHRSGNAWVIMVLNPVRPVGGSDLDGRRFARTIASRIYGSDSEKTTDRVCREMAQELTMPIPGIPVASLREVTIPNPFGG